MQTCKLSSLNIVINSNKLNRLRKSIKLNLLKTNLSGIFFYDSHIYGGHYVFPNSMRVVMNKKHILKFKFE